MTVADVLRDRGLETGRRFGREHRTVCPVHGGNNDTSFAYADSVWRCHSCRRGGGVVQLIAALDGVDEQTARKTLSGRRRRTLRERSALRRGVRQRRAAAAKERAERARDQRSFDDGVRRLDDTLDDIELIERIWQRDPDERCAETRRAVGLLGDLYLRRDAVEFEVFGGRW